MKKAIFSFLILTIVKSVWAEMPAAQFLLDSNPNPRLYSMGNALSAAHYGDIYSNPASLGWTVNRGFYLSHWPGQLKDSQYNFLSGVFPFLKNNYLGFSYLSYDAGTETIEELDGTTRSITLEKDSVVSLALGAALSQKVFAGLNLKRLSSTLAEDYSASSFMFDLDLMHRSLDDSETWELALLNSGGGINYSSVKEKLPTELRLGYSRRLKFSSGYSLVTSAGYGKVSAAGSSSVSGGLEFFPGIRLFSARAGFIKKTGEDMQWTSGFGLRFTNIDMDFAYALKKSNYEQSALYRFSLGYYFGPSGQGETADAYLKKGMKEKALALWKDIRPYESDYADARVKINTYMEPPVLEASARFVSESGAEILPGGGSGEIIVTVKNSGKSPALDLNVEVTPLAGVTGGVKIMPYLSKIVSIDPGETAEVSIPVTAAEELDISKLGLVIKVEESRGFNSSPLTFTLNTKRFPPPEPLLAKYTFREDNTGLSQGNGNGQIEKGETVEVTAILANIGESPAKNVAVSLKSGAGLEIIKNPELETITALKPGEYKKLVFVFSVPANYSGPAKLPISVKIAEERAKYSKIQALDLHLGKFYVDPLTASEAGFSDVLAGLPDIPGPIPGGKAAEVVKNYSGGAPDLEFSSEISGDENGNGVYDPGEVLCLTLGIRNSGRGEAENVKVIISGDETAAALLGSPFAVGDIPPGKYQRVELSGVIPASIPRKTANFTVKVREAKGFSPNKAEAKSVGFQPKETVVAKTYPSLRPVPLSKQPARGKSFALVVGISEYQNIKKGLRYASSDAGTVKDYLNGVMGVPEENIKVFADREATKSRIEAEINRLTDRKPERIFLYFAGHGIFDLKDPRTGNPFIVPYDADLEYGNDTLISLKDIVAKLESSGAGEVAVMLDSCFSGEGGIGGEKQLLAKRAIAIEPVLDYRKTLIISAASGRQMAGEFDKAGGHGYLTYYMLLGLKGEADQNKDGDITDKELCEYVTSSVDGETGGRQTPECKNAKGTVMGRYK